MKSFSIFALEHCELTLPEGGNESKSLDVDDFGDIVRSLSAGLALLGRSPVSSMPMLSFLATFRFSLAALSCSAREERFFEILSLAVACFGGIL